MRDSLLFVSSVFAGCVYVVIVRSACVRVTMKAMRSAVCDTVFSEFFCGDAMSD
jgi:hypothetical protein